MASDYSLTMQKFYLRFLLSSEDTFARCQNIVKSSYFDSELGPAVDFIKEYAEANTAVPLLEEINSRFNFQIEKLNGLTKQHEEGFLATFEEFCRHKAIEAAVMGAPEKLQKGNYADIEAQVREALLVSLQKDLGTDYYDDPRARLERMRTRNATISTGWKSIDSKLYGGMNRGEMTIFAGNAGMGKSLFLQNLALNWSNQGLFCVYFTFELSEELTSMRLDAMLTGISTRDIFKSLDEVELKVGMAQKKQGRIQVKYMSAGCSANDLRAYLKELEIQTGKKPDAICIDYLDLMYPNNKKVNPSDLFVKDKFVSEELRALAAETGALLATASQLNRSAVEENDHDIAHIAGGLSKVNTADNVMTIYTSTAMRERGEYRVQFIKTRSSSGVGSKVFLKFDPTCLRIVDMPEDYEPEELVTPSQTALKLKEQIKGRTSTGNASAEVRETAVVENESKKRINDILGGFKRD